MLEAFLVFLWSWCGIASFAYWWTRQFDLRTEDLFAAVAVGVFFGPMWFVIGFIIHFFTTHPEYSHVVLKKRD